MHDGTGANDPHLLWIKHLRDPITVNEMQRRLLAHPENWCPAGPHCTNLECKKPMGDYERMYLIELGFRVDGILPPIIRVGFACSERCAAIHILSWWKEPPTQRELSQWGTG